MSNNLSEYQEQLQAEVKLLQEKISKLEEEMMQVKLKFELRKNDLQDEASRELVDYRPQSMGLEFSFDAEKFNVTDEDITKTLNKMFKVNQ